LLSTEANQTASAADSHPAGLAVPPEWTGRTVTFPRERTVLDFFQAQVQARPDAVAVQAGNRMMSYDELNRKSDLVAEKLLSLRFRTDEVVVIMVPLSCEYLAGIIGILKAGGCYFPIEMETPANRLEFLLGDCQARFAWSDAASRERFKHWAGTTLDLAQVTDNLTGPRVKSLDVPADPNRPAYLLYTSGSTGQPKGVQIEHHSLTNFVCFYHRYFGLTPQDRSSMLAYIAFDVSVSDIWPVLCAGGTVVVPPKGILGNPDGLIRWLETQEITMSFVPTGLVEILFTRSWPRQMKLRWLVTGGDRLRVRPPADLPFTVINGYGPTECTVFATLSVVTPDDRRDTPPPIGRPLDNVTAYVLDEKLQQLPVGEAGELYLGGEQVARGYLGRRELTAERFLSDPFSKKPGARMYRTGDWARWLPDGELDFLGRKDGQIQIRGYRVELGEIEATLFAHGAVRQVCCVPWLDEGMPSGVVAHIVPENPGNGLKEELRTYLCERLPDYMVPSDFVMHESLPLTPQGKLDRAALTQLPAAAIQASPQISASEDGLEKALAQLWHTLLPAAKGSPADATFAVLGGDSLLAIKLVLGVEEITGLRLEVSTFLINPTFAGLCETVKNRVARNEFEPVLALRKHGTRPPIFCLYGHNGDIDAYFNLAEALGDDQPVFGIRSAALENSSRLPQSMEEAASEVLRCIRKIQPHGALVVVGYSWAGLLAFEVTRQLAKTGEVQCYTALIGTMAPLRPPNFISRLAHFFQYFPGWLWNLITDHKHRRQRLMRWREMARDTKQNLAQARLPVEEWEWLSSPFSRHMINLMEKYRPFPISDISVELFRERDGFRPKPHPLQVWQIHHRPDGGWNLWTKRRNRIHWFAADHETIIKQPAVSEVAQTLRQAMDQNLHILKPLQKS
jgi:amino acid adenylation domain-containing protein